jgi:hypothetical protein
MVLVLLAQERTALTPENRGNEKSFFIKCSPEKYRQIKPCHHEHCANGDAKKTSI